MKANFVKHLVFCAFGALLGFGAGLHTKKAPVIVERVERVAPRVSTKVFLRERDQAFKQLYDHWRFCAQTVARIEVMAVHERYDSPPRK